MDQNNKDFITRFYSAFQTLDYEHMQKAYHPEAQFTDPIFGTLNYEEVKAMWKMLLTRGQDLQVAFSNIEATTTTGKCRWEAWYKFSKTGRNVHNIIHSTFEFKDGKIYRQRDAFSVWRWSRYALGVAGIFLGWSPWIQNEIKQGARESLTKFMK
ncbi:nuclear transport factor 2 family protein [Chryseolinea sp. H1M3-3]|uniref:nuclear transport factor 2 family protein n=1 Tax=Chryseolinea sp. H1M3-3 TaxID=3034144 RepID=UPI0023ED93D6|nr:nuclear transport factor 2 family protein [Chryseolinea sp. H1M3-3]